MSAPYASIRERLLYRTFDWVTSDLELQAWSGGVFNEAHIRVSDLAATGAHPGAKSVETPLAFIRPGGYAASDSIKLPGGNFTVGELVTFVRPHRGRHDDKRPPAGGLVPGQVGPPVLPLEPLARPADRRT